MSLAADPTIDAAWLAILAWEDSDGARVLRPLSGPRGFARLDGDTLTLRASADVSGGTPASVLLVDPRGAGSVLLAGAIASAGAEHTQLTVVERFADGNPPHGPDHAFIPVPDAKLEPSCGDRLGAQESELLLGADAAVLCARSPTERLDGPDGLALAYRTGPPGFLLAAHETLILLPATRDDPFWRAVADLAGHAEVTLLAFSPQSGERVEVAAHATILRRREHAARFPEADRAVELAVKAVVRRPAGVAHLPAPRPSSSVAVANGRPPLHRQPQVLSVNVSPPRIVEDHGRPVSTGIFKTPVQGRTFVRRLNLEGDGQADRWGHGGAFKAVYAYAIESYDFWAQQLGRRDFAPGQFGENLTMAAMPDELVHIGDVLGIGEAVLEVTQPRVPCFKLGIRMAIDGFEQRFLQSNRVGFYLRVLEEGTLAAGDAIELLHRPANAPSVADVTRAYYLTPDDHDLALNAFQAPALAHGWKTSFEERLHSAGRLS